MSKRNLVWLAVIIVVGALAWIQFGVIVGIVAALVVLAISEVVERRARRRRREAAG